MCCMNRKISCKVDIEYKELNILPFMVEGSLWHIPSLCTDSSVIIGLFVSSRSWVWPGHIVLWFLYVETWTVSEQNKHSVVATSPI
jgi:hypothetical protein